MRYRTEIITNHKKVEIIKQKAVKDVKNTNLQQMAASAEQEAVASVDLLLGLQEAGWRLTKSEPLEYMNEETQGISSVHIVKERRYFEC